MIPSSRLGSALVLAGFMAGCGVTKRQRETPPRQDDPRAMLDTEEETRARSEAVTLTVDGAIMSINRRPVAGATVRIAGRATRTNWLGRFKISGLERQNHLLEVSARGFYGEAIAVVGNLPVDQISVSLQPIFLTATSRGSTRFLFAGDVALGRRFLDPKGTTPRDQIPADHPSALIQASDPGPGSEAVFQFVRPLLATADYRVVNLETPVLDDPSTPHPEKEFAFFTLPGSMAALVNLGVDYVGLGNNHVYDYLDHGLEQTLAHLAAHRLANSGAGLNAQEAFKPYRETINGTPYSLLSVTSVSGDQHEISYVATADKGGAADGRNDRDMHQTLRAELRDGQVPIVQLHTGTEYTYSPVDDAKDRFEQAVRLGAALVVGHHPHVAQGVEMIDGKYVIHSLGNFAFDQDRMETLLGLVARVDMDRNEVSSIRMLPVYIEDYRPRMITGRLADLFLRRIGEFSPNVLIVPYHGQGWVVGDPAQAKVVDRTVAIDVTIPESGVSVIDLREIAESDESLLALRAEAKGLKGRSGRDLMIYGDLEDQDLDRDRYELPRWDVRTRTSYACSGDAYRGVTALCSARSAIHRTASVIAYRNSIRVMGDALDQPKKDLTVFGYVRGENAGPLTINVRYHASQGDKTFGEEDAYKHPGGTFAWQSFSADLHMPPDATQLEGSRNNARAVRVFLRHGPPKRGKGLARFDEMAVIGWEDELDLTGEHALKVPHARDFIQVRGVPGRHKLSLTFRTFRPVRD